MSSQLPAPLQPSPLSTDTSLFQYRESDILDLLKHSRNYNRWLTDQVPAFLVLGRFFEKPRIEMPQTLSVKAIAIGTGRVLAQPS